MTSMVLPALEFPRFWIDFNAFSVRPVPRGSGDVITHRSQRVLGSSRKTRLERQLVRQVLVMKPWSIDRLLNIQTTLRRRKKDIRDRRDNPRAARRPQHVAQLSILQHNRRCHRRKRPLARCDRVRWSLDQAIHVRRAHLGGKVIHLVIQEKAKTSSRHIRSESIVQRRGHADGIPVFIDDGVVGRIWRFGPLPGSLWRRRQEAIRTLQIGAGRSFVCDASAPCRRVFLARQLRCWNLVEIRIAQVFAAIHVRPAKSLSYQVNPRWRTVAEIRQIVGFKDVQRRKQHHSTRRRRRRADHGVIVEGSCERRPLFHFVVRQIVERDQAAAFSQIGYQLLRQLAVIKIRWVGCDPLECLRQLRLLEDLVGLVIMAIALKDPLGIWKERQGGVM